MHKLLEDFSITAVFAGFITFLVGISVSSVLVIQAAQNLGANTAQISSWFWALGTGIGLCALLLSWKFKYPVVTSWSTAGLALIIASSGGYSLNEALGAFLICGLLTVILGYLGIFERILSFIPQSLTSAMLAGVLLKFGIEVFAQLEQGLAFVLAVLASYILSKRLWPRYSIVITVIASFALSPVFMDIAPLHLNWGISQPIWTTPHFSTSAILGLALPLLVINMASQYLPGLAMLKSYGYSPNIRPLVGWTGFSQMILAPFGCFSVNIAAISAAISLDDQAHNDPSKRYIAGMSCGIFYILMGLFAATLTSLLLSFPALFMVTLAGIALFATIGHNIVIAFGDTEQREAALMTFLFSASGVQFLGIGSAFWGLLFGCVVSMIYKQRKK